MFGLNNEYNIKYANKWSNESMCFIDDIFAMRRFYDAQRGHWWFVGVYHTYRSKHIRRIENVPLTNRPYDLPKNY